MYIIDQRGDNDGDVGVKAVCSFDCSSFALNNIELTVHKEPSEKEGHLRRKDNKKNTPLVYMFTLK